MTRRGVSRKKLACIGCGCSAFVYLLLMRNVAPRLLVRQTSHTGHDSNRLDEQRELLSELILRKQPHLHRQQDGIGEIAEQDNDNIQPHLHRQQEANEGITEQDNGNIQPHLHRQQEANEDITEQDNGNIHHGQQRQNDQRHLRPLHQQEQELEREEQQRYNEEQDEPQQDLHIRNDLHRVQLQQHIITTTQQQVTANAGLLTSPHLARRADRGEHLLDSRHKNGELTWINKAMHLKVKPDLGNPNRIDTSMYSPNSTGLDRTPGKLSNLVIVADDRVRNCITGDIIGRRPTNVITGPLKVGEDASREDTKSRVESFQKVFDTRAWGHSWDPSYKGVNASGCGATLAWTQEFTATLHRVLSELRAVRGLSKIRLLDVPCGDMAWMARFLQTRDDIDYTGVDIVESMIEGHRKKYGRFGWKFVAGDVLQTGINGTYDLIVNRMMLQHLYHKDVVRLLDAFSRSGSAYLLTTTFAGHARNEELSAKVDGKNPGRFRMLNLEIEPVSLEAPLCLQRDGPPDHFAGWNHFVALWRLPLNRIRWCTTAKPFPLKSTSRTLYSCAPWA